MLKRIATTQLQLGMFLHAFDGHWIDHPFWRSSFLIQDPTMLARARASSVAHCWIDVAKGADVAAAPGAPLPLPAAPGETDETDDGAAATGCAAPMAAVASTMEEELRRAAWLCRSASQQVARLFADARLGQALAIDACHPIVDDIAESLRRNAAAVLNLSRLKTQDDYSYMHSVAVCALMIALARQIGFDDEQCRQAGLAGLLHDVGKALMPSEILNKPGKLDDAEFATIKDHPVRGHELLSAASELPASALDVCLHHHERVDGTGYPHRLAGDDIGVFARMGAICDVYDAVTSDRPYKKGWNPADAVAKMAQWKGHFDPVLLKAFITAVGVYPIGSLIRLESGRVAVVTAQGASSLGRPRVKVFFSLKSQLPIEPKLVDLSTEDCPDRIAGLEDPAAWSEREVARLWAGDAVPRGYGESPAQRAGVRAPRRA